MKSENISIRLKKIMQETGLRQVDILDKAKPFCIKYNIKLQSNDLSQYISNKVKPSQKKLEILSLALNVNEAWLMGYDVPREVTRIITNSNEKSDIEVFKTILNHKGFLNDNEKFTEKNFNELIAFIIANKQFIMRDKN